MKYAFCGGKLLDGTREMQPREGLVLRTDGDRITDIVPEGTDLTGYEVVNLKGGYLMPGLINITSIWRAAASLRKSSGTTRSW